MRLSWYLGYGDIERSKPYSHNLQDGVSAYGTMLGAC